MGYLAVVICNFNGGQYTVDCIKAVQKNTYNDLDIIVVDNASTDSAVELLTNEFGDSITILLNDINCGGAGGFGRGLRYATENNYEYIITFALLYLFLICDLFLCNNCGIEVYIRA